MSEYTATVRWQRGDQVFTDGRFRRAHRWNFDGTKCLSPSCSPLPSAILRARKAEEMAKAKKELAAAQRKAEMPAWLRTKPRSPKQLKEALAYCRSQGYPTDPPPWDDAAKL